MLVSRRVKMIDIEKERKAFESALPEFKNQQFIIFSPKKKIYEVAENRPWNFNKSAIHEQNAAWKVWLKCVAPMRTELEPLKQQLAAAHESRIDFVEYARKIESGEYELVKKADNKSLNIGVGLSNQSL